MKYEKKVFLIGAWTNFYELEESLTLDELIELYGTMLDEEAEEFKRDAALQGVSIPDQDEEEGESFEERLARKRAEQQEDMNAYGKARFGEGQGYMVVGG